MDEPFSNREIKEFFKEVNEKLDDIKAQTTRTNGRVGKLENWRSYTVGAVTVFVLIGVPLLSYLFKQVNMLDKNQNTIIKTLKTEL